MKEFDLGLKKIFNSDFNLNIQNEIDENSEKLNISTLLKTNEE